MAPNPAKVLSLLRPAWVGEDVAMAYDMARRFLEAEIAPRYDHYEKNEIVDRSAWKKAGAAGLLCASVPAEYGGAGGTFAHETMFAEAASHVGVDGFGIVLHNTIVVPSILRECDGRMPAVVRRLRLHEGISDRANVARRPRSAHLRRHQRDHEALDRKELVGRLTATENALGGRPFGEKGKQTQPGWATTRK